MVLDATVALIVLFLAALGFFRGFIKEVFGIGGLVASVIITTGYNGYFVDVYSVRVHSEILAKILSGITVFIGVMTCVVIVNGLVIRLLDPLRRNSLDRIAGLFVGVTKGLALAYCVFFVMETFLYVFAPYPKSDDPNVQGITLPSWFMDTYSYNCFSLVSKYVGNVISEPAYDTIGSIAHELLDKRRFDSSSSAVDMPLQE